MKPNGESVEDLRDGISLSDLLFGESAGGKAVLRAFESQMADLIDAMLMADSAEELTAKQNQAVGILHALTKMGGNIDMIRMKAAAQASKRSVRTALNLHETMTE